MFPRSEKDLEKIQHLAHSYREVCSAFLKWSEGYGIVQHSDETQVRVYNLCQQFVAKKYFNSIEDALKIFEATDRICSAAMWLVVHMTYANKVDLSGQALSEQDFKVNPQGHTGGSLNMVPAYVAYMAANSLAGKTRSWLMGQGHCVAAVDSINVLLENLLPEQAERYGANEKGLSHLVKDFYSYAINADGSSGVPLGSHVNPYTAGGVIEGGYLGFAELQYVHMPLPGEHLVAFLSDGAFEEQRGSDWASRWWRAEDSGLVTPIMIANGRRIDQRSTMYQQGGLEWFYHHLQLNGFDPITIDGKDPAAFIWSIFESEFKLNALSESIKSGVETYPIKLPYIIAETIKGFGFYGAGTNAAHGTPLPNNPRNNLASRELFNTHAKHLWVSEDDIAVARNQLNNHLRVDREFERNHPLANRNVKLKSIPEIVSLSSTEKISPMEGIDHQFLAIVKANPHLRPRVANPDELRSNKMNATLDALLHRVTNPEEGVAEGLNGCVITALNEEAIISAVLANKGGINIAVSYESFAPKMLGALRQEIIFSRHQKDLGRAPKWLSLPVIATSHLWENGKNEQSHQDPSFGEVLINEMNDISRVIYPSDALSAAMCLSACYQTHGQIWAMTVPKQTLRSILNVEQAAYLIEVGAVYVSGNRKAKIQLIAIGAYQLSVCLEVQNRLLADNIESELIYMLEPAKFRIPRDKHEASYVTEQNIVDELFGNDKHLRVFVCHFHPETIFSVCRPLDLGRDKCKSYGYINRGGTFDTDGLLLANQCNADFILSDIKKTLSAL